MADAQATVRYERGGFGTALPRGRRPAVVVVDLALGFTDPEAKLGAELTDVVKATRGLLDVARERGVPVAFTAIGFAPDLSDLGLWATKAPGGAQLVVGTRWTEIDPRLERREGEPVFVKQAASGCFGTSLVSTLIRWGVDTTVVAGTSTSGCVRATVVDLFQLGYPVLVPRDCVGDRFPDSHEVGLFDMHAKYADVIDVADALDYLRGADLQ
jgi:maleamate amidohydrolase